MTEQPFTPAEIADLRIIAGRARMDRGDIAPMIGVAHRHDGTRDEIVIPWLQALNMEID